MGPYRMMDPIVEEYWGRYRVFKEGRQQKFSSLLKLFLASIQSFQDLDTPETQKWLEKTKSVILQTVKFKHRMSIYRLSIDFSNVDPLFKTASISLEFLLTAISTSLNIVEDSPLDMRQMAFDLERLLAPRTRFAEGGTHNVLDKETVQLTGRAMDVLYNDIKITILERLCDPKKGPNFWEPGKNVAEDVVARHWDYIRSLVNRTSPVLKAPEMQTSPVLEANSLGLGPETKLSTPFKYLEEILKHITNPEPEPERPRACVRESGKKMDVGILLEALDLQQDDIKTMLKNFVSSHTALYQVNLSILHPTYMPASLRSTLPQLYIDLFFPSLTLTPSTRPNSPSSSLASTLINSRPSSTASISTTTSIPRKDTPPPQPTGLPATLARFDLYLSILNYLTHIHSSTKADPSDDPWGSLLALRNTLVPTTLTQHRSKTQTKWVTVALEEAMRDIRKCVVEHQRFTLLTRTEKKDGVVVDQIVRQNGYGLEEGYGRDGEGLAVELARKWRGVTAFWVGLEGEERIEVGGKKDVSWDVADNQDLPYMDFYRDSRF